MNWFKKWKLRWVELGVGGLLLAAVTWFVAIPEYRRARDARWAKECRDNIVKIDGAKEQYAVEFNKKAGYVVGWTDIVDPTGGTGYLKEKQRCPAGHEYMINAIGTVPECGSHLEGHTVSMAGIAITAD